MGLDGMASARGHRMQGTEHDIAFFLALGCAIALHCIALYCSVLYCTARAGLHGERPRTPYARNGVWHSVFSSVGPCRRFSNQNCVRNKTACADFPTQNRWKTKRDAGLFLHIFGVKINRFFFDFGVIFLPEGTPGASWVALESPWAPKIEF